MIQLDVHQESGRSAHVRRPKNAAAQQRALSAMGVQVSLSVLQELPPGGWLRFVPKVRPIDRTF